MKTEIAKAKIKELQEIVRRNESRDKGKERAAYTRKKIIAGAFLIEESGQWKTILKSDKFDKFVTRPIDRKLFGLEVTEEVTKNISAATEKEAITPSPDKEVSKSIKTDIATVKQIGFIKDLIATSGKNIKDFDDSLDQDSLDSLPKDKAGPLIDWLKIK